MSESLTEFLLARIAEDEAPTFEIVPYDCKPDCCAPEGWVGRRCLICDLVPVYGGTVEAITEIAREHDEDIHRRSRVLAECEAKRRIIDAHHPEGRINRHSWSCGCGCQEVPEMGCACGWRACPTLRLLGIVYADHDDYREEWKP